MGGVDAAGDRGGALCQVARRRGRRARPVWGAGPGARVGLELSARREKSARCSTAGTWPRP